MSQDFYGYDIRFDNFNFLLNLSVEFSFYMNVRRRLLQYIFYIMELNVPLTAYTDVETWIPSRNDGKS